jgi:6-phosphogluconolactonase (cycloisomerase 2 family)
MSDTMHSIDSTPRVSFLLRLSLVVALGLAAASCASTDGDGGEEKTFAYVANRSDSTISGFRLNTSTGELKETPNSPYTAGDSPLWLVASPGGEFLFAANSGDDTIYSYVIDQGNGSLELADQTGTLDEPHTAVVTPDGAFLYAGAYAGNAYDGFEIDPDSGELSGISGFSATSDGGPHAAAITPAGTLLYSANFTSSVIRVYDIQADGTLSESSVSPISASASPIALVIDANGEYVYALSNGGLAVDGFSIKDTSGDLEAIEDSPFTTGSAPTDIAITFAGGYVYVSDEDGIRVFARNASDGRLLETEASPVAVLGRAGGIAVDPSGRILIVTDRTDDIIRMYTINADTGELTKADDSPEPVGVGPRTVAIVTITP